MPAELDYSKGRAAILSVGETPWHKEGVVLVKPPRSADEALELAGLDFEVALEPIFARWGHAGKARTGSTGDGSAGDADEYSYVEGFSAVRRLDTGTVLGVVGDGYAPLQNRDAFRILEPLIDNGLAHIETAGALRGGRDVWILIRFNIKDPVVSEVFAEEVVPYGLLSNNHCGARSVVLQETPIRVVCANTLGMALKGPGRKVAIRHTVSVGARTVDAAKRIWGSLIERYRVIAEQYRCLKRKFLDQSLFEKLVLDVVAQLPEAEGHGSKARARAVERAERRRARLGKLWKEGAGHRGDGSAWEAYNAVVQSLDHDVELWPTPGPRTASLFDGHLRRLKQQVLDKLVEYAGPPR
jgi:phage/plasmid-like protein (TIGR03299 family)